MDSTIPPTTAFVNDNVPEPPISPSDSDDDPGPSTSSRPVTARDRNRVRKLADSQRKKAKKEQETEEQRKNRLKTDADRAALRRSLESAQEADVRRQRDASHTAAVRFQMTEEEKNTARETHSSQVAEARALIPEDVAAERRRRDTKSKARIRFEESEDNRATRRASNARRAASRKSEETQEDRNARREEDANRAIIRRSMESEVVAYARRDVDARRARKRRFEETEDVRNERREQDAVSTAHSRAFATSEEASVRRCADRTRKASRRSGQLSVATSPIVHVEPHYAGRMDQECPGCGALYFTAEKTTTGTFNKCCQQGNVQLDLFEDFPSELKDLFVAQTSDASHFRENIRNYNNAVSMGSMNAKLDVPKGRGPYCFRLHGQVYHLTGPLHPADGEQRQFAQIFFLDTSQAAEELAGRQVNAACKEDMFKTLIKILEHTNPFVQSYKTMRQVEQEEQQKAIQEGRVERPVKMTFRVRSEDDQRRYQLPTSTEVAVVFVGDDDEIPGERRITVHQKGGRLQSFRDTDPQCDPMTYPLLFPTGKYGWHVNIAYANPRNKRTRVSLREFYSFHLHVRKSFSPLFFGGKLFQQFTVDTWTKCEQNRLNFIRQNQDQLRIEHLNRLQDYVVGEEQGGIGSRIVLPASHTGSPRNMVSQSQDAIAVVGRYGKPDYFLTMTCNPKWREIEECLEEGQTASDRPDIVSRVFNMKLRSLCDDLHKKKVLGEPVAWIHVVEFQKRGLPHCHMLIIMKPGSKPRTSADVDRVISAELPDKDADPQLWDIVTKTMMHRPCGAHNPSSPCMRNGSCDKKFPKAFRNDTSVDHDGFPLYRRRDDGRKIKSGSTELDNRHVVPYNRWLLLKFNCQINLEVCGAISSIKYLYKYVYKGTTRASVRIHTDASGAQHEIVDEIDRITPVMSALPKPSIISSPTRCQIEASPWSS